MRLDGPLAIVPWVVVFGVGFAVGYALMSAMVDEPTVGEPQAVGAADSGEPAPSPPAPEAGGDAESTVAAEPAPARPTPPPVALPESAKAEEASDDEVPDDEAPEAEAEPQPWWEQCRTADCTIDFGAITGGLSIRRASLEHGATVSWDRDFARRPRQEVLPTEAGVDVKLLSVGLDTAGKPVAAEISYKKSGGRPVQGVISLDLGEPGKQVIFRP